MSARRRPGLRFVVEAVVIVLTAVGSGLLHLGVWGIIAAVAVAWVIVAIVEYSLSHPKGTGPPAPEPEAVSDTVPVSDTVEPQPEPEPEREEPAPVVARQWNIWELDQALRATSGPTEEQEFLLLYLRDFAGPDGLLPLDFDALVRESFGDPLGTPAA